MTEGRPKSNGRRRPDGHDTAFVVISGRSVAEGKGIHSYLHRYGSPFRSCGPPGMTGGSARSQDHDDLAALEVGLHLDLGEIAHIGLDPVQDPEAQLLVRHFAAA